jgi:hypothetical protein
MLDQTQAMNILGDILESPEFIESQRYRELLQYLVEESLEGRSPKQSIIGIRFFGKEASFDSKEDATVRVYINNLRKKLEHYYLTSGKTHPFRLNIPVGHYKVEFIPATEAEGHPQMDRTVFAYVPFAAGIIASLAVGYFIGWNQHFPSETFSVPNPLWTDFVKAGARPTLFVLGDYFFLRERGEISAYYRTITINTPEDFQERLRRDTSFARRYEQNDFTYIRPSAPWGIAQILPIIQKSKSGYSIKLASQFTTSDFKANNVVFIGALKTLFSFRQFLHIFNIDYTVGPGSVKIHSEEGESVHEFLAGRQRGGGYVKDISIIAKGAGPEGSTILMLLGFSESGVIGACRAASDTSLFDAMALKYPNQSFSDPTYFTLVLGTEGIANAIINSDIRAYVPNKPPSSFFDANQKDSSQAR